MKEKLVREVAERKRSVIIWGVRDKTITVRTKLNYEEKISG